VLCGCIDIGTNTTRVLVADARAGGLTEILQQKAFTRLGRGLTAGGRIPTARIAENAGVVAEQFALAEQAGARSIRAVATAVIRSAANREEFCRAMREHGGVDVSVLDGEEEARLAFLGATHTHAGRLDGAVGVVDVGGGSTEVVVGTLDDGVQWWGSVAVGSSRLTDEQPLSDPPTHAELAAMDRRAREALAGLDIPAAGYAMGVGGSATSLRRLVGPVLDSESLARALGVLSAAPGAAVAERFAIEPERVALLPAGILVLAAAARRLGRELHVGCGGLREGVLLDLAGGR
jgi:exopolyphosphatase / guanosine-5'-triphosphate,3'-diphosphate pyrophosphatase